MSGKIFINYRRKDVPDFARLIKKELEVSFTRDRIFFDNTHIDTGEAFDDKIGKEIRESDIILVLIGPNWLMPDEATQQPRLWNAKDWVRVEIELAIQHGIFIVPILRGEAVMPGAEQLPESLRFLLYRKWFQIRDDKWDRDIEELVSTLNLRLERIAVEREERRLQEQEEEAFRLEQETQTQEWERKLEQERQEKVAAQRQAAQARQESAAAQLQAEQVRQEREAARSEAERERLEREAVERRLQEAQESRIDAKVGQKAHDRKQDEGIDQLTLRLAKTKGTKARRKLMEDWLTDYTKAEELQEQARQTEEERLAEHTRAEVERLERQAQATASRAARGDFIRFLTVKEEPLAPPRRKRGWIHEKLFGNWNQQQLRKIWPLVQEINRKEEALHTKPDHALREMTAGWKAHLSRYQERVEYFSAHALQVMPLEEMHSLSESWVKRLEYLINDFPGAKALTVLLRAEEMRGTPESWGHVILRAQSFYSQIREEFPALRQAYLSQILPEAYAVVKNAARRLRERGETWLVCDQPMTWDMVHFDVQLIGGIALNGRHIAEMATGEGKTLVATLPVFLNALTGLGVHVVTVNDYLARRDSEWMGPLLRWLGLTVGCLQNSQESHTRREAYACDVTYGAASEFGFDYLRDYGMATTTESQVQRGYYFALIDEVDSVLLDEARTPLLISGPATSSYHQLERFKPMVAQLVRRQDELCDSLFEEAVQAVGAGDLDAAGLALYKMKIGRPRHSQLERLMEDHVIRRALEKAELSFNQSTRKAALFELKESLYFTIDERQNNASLTEMGRAFLDPDDSEAFLVPDSAAALAQLDGDLTLNDAERESAKLEWQSQVDRQAERLHCIHQLLKAYCVYEADKEYIVENGQVIILEESSGRPMPGRRWSDGLHQAVEAKEGVRINQDTQTLATITVQNYFRLYSKLAGMTGTAEIDAPEFADVYGLDVLVIPPNRPVQRYDANDRVYKTQREKLAAVVSVVEQHHGRGQPVLIGTASPKTSETISRLLTERQIPHSILNAKHHRQEAEIIARAGLKGAVTVSTEMAARGTNILLGEGVLELGGLLVIGTERHSSRRIDRQLRGRCGRQGQPGSSVFFVSFEDELMRQYGASDRMIKLMERLHLDDGQELEGRLLTRTIETAQRKVEERNYLRRKWVFEYDNVLNQQRKAIYGYRNEVLTTADPRALIMEVINRAVPAQLDSFLGRQDYPGLIHWVASVFPIRAKETAEQLAAMPDERVTELIATRIKEAYEVKMAHEDPEHSDELERFVILMAVDQLWREHVSLMDGLRDTIQARGQSQPDPLVEYKRNGHDLFVSLLEKLENEILRNLFLYRTARSVTPVSELKAGLADLFGGGDVPVTPTPPAPPLPEEPAPDIPVYQSSLSRDIPRVGRNDPCPCGSGNKYKLCCGRMA